MMKRLVYGFLFVLLLSGSAFAQEQCAGTAVSAAVSPSTEQHCDIYSRQIEYRKNAAAFRKSLEERQRGYGEKDDALIRNYNGNLEKIYAQERVAYRKEMSTQDEQDGVDIIDQINLTPQDAAGVQEKIVVIHDDGSRTRIIVPADAPNF